MENEKTQPRRSEPARELTQGSGRSGETSNRVSDHPAEKAHASGGGLKAHGDKLANAAAAAAGRRDKQDD